MYKNLKNGRDIPIEFRSREEVTSLYFKRQIAPVDIKVKNPAFNAQNGVDDKCQVITAVKIIATGSDNGELFPMVELSKKNTGKTHKNNLADCGYSNKEMYNAIEALNEDSEYYVPDRTMYSSKKNKYSRWHFIHDTNKDVYLCPEGRELKYVRTSKDSKGHFYRLYHGVNCNAKGILVENSAF